MSVSAGSACVLNMLCGKPLQNIISSGARLLECACGPCIGMGFSPSSGGVSVRTFNRNFLGRSGTVDALVYLASPETAVACAITGRITDPSQFFGGQLDISLPDVYLVDEDMFEQPLSVEEAEDAEIVRGKNIKECPAGKAPENELVAEIAIKTGDNITTDHIIPAGSKILPYRSNVPKLSSFCFSCIDEGFPERAMRAGSSVIVGGENYGQGSSREHAALTLVHLGVRAVIAKSFARIHLANLINSGIVPLVFKNAGDYDKLAMGDKITLVNLLDGISTGSVTAVVGGAEIELICSLSYRQQEIIRAGGLLRLTGK
jgi:aconitate hydratase